MFLTTSLAGKAQKEREILYDGEVCLLEDKPGRVLGITSCFIYEMRFKNRHVADSILLEAEFIAELAYEYLDSDGAKLKNIKKLSCHQRLFPVIQGLSGTFSGQESLFITPVVRSAAYRYEITGDGTAIHLILSAAIEYLATNAYYSNILECGEEEPAPARPIECLNWQSVLDSIRPDDALACLENLIRLLKLSTKFREQEKAPASSTSAASGMEEELERLRELNQSLENGLHACRTTIAHLRSELREREEIISKLLLLLDKASPK